MKFLSLLPILILLVDIDISYALDSFKESAQCNQKDFEKLFDRVARLGMKKDKFPENVAQLEIYCQSLFKDLKKLDGFKKRNCFNDSLKSFMSILVYSIRNHMKRICDKKSSRKTTELLASGHCMNEHEEKLDRCMTNINRNMIAIREVPNKLKTPHMCCQYVDLVDCITDAFVKTSCEAKTAVAIANTNSVMGNFQNNYCGEFTLETDRCSKLPKLKALKEANGSFVINLANIFDSINLAD